MNKTLATRHMKKPITRPTTSEQGRTKHHNTVTTYVIVGITVPYTAKNSQNIHCFNPRPFFARHLLYYHHHLSLSSLITFLLLPHLATIVIITINYCFCSGFLPDTAGSHEFGKIPTQRHLFWKNPGFTLREITTLPSRKSG